MKQLKSSLGDLRGLFSRTITLRDIAEPLVSLDHDRPPEEVRRLMESRDFDVIGLREHGIVTGYVRRQDLDRPAAAATRTPFEPAEVLPDTAPLHAAFAALRDRRHVFITLLGQVGGIVTRGDLQKAPVRLWLFGLVSLLEMQMLRVVRERYPEDSWAPLLSEDRLGGARQVFEERRRRNEESDLSDCLQLGDKATILMKDRGLFAHCGFASRRSMETFFKEVGLLRNALAHANDIRSGRWPALVDLVTRLEQLIEALEVTPPPRIRF